MRNANDSRLHLGNTAHNAPVWEVMQAMSAASAPEPFSGSTRQTQGIP